MNFFFLLSTTALISLVGCSHHSMDQRYPASVTDVGVIGPEGDVLLYYKENNHIIVKNCGKYTVLGSSPEEARKKCQGKSSKVPLQLFKNSLKSYVNTDKIESMGPLSPQDIRNFKRPGVSSEKIQEMMAELDKIEKFIQAYGPESVNQTERANLITALSVHSTRLAAINKINAEIDKTIALITDDSKLTITKASTDKHLLLYNALKNFDPASKYSCGLQGSVPERIKDCSAQEGLKQDGFVLVARTSEFYEIYQDSNTGLLWSDRQPLLLTQDGAISECKSPGKVPAIAGISWKLPTKEQYEEAEKNGIRESLPNMNFSFWSSSVSKVDFLLAWSFSKNKDSSQFISRTTLQSARCVGN